MVSNRALDREEIERIIREKDRKAHPGSLGPKWPNIEEKKRIALAIKERATYVFLRNDRMFVVTKKNRHGEVFVKPKVGFSPCGAFNVDDLLREYG